MSRQYTILPCSGMAIEAMQGERITVIDTDGGQVADFFAEALDHAEEFLSAGVTIDCNESLRLNVGSIIYSNLYNPMFRVVSDDVGEHDLLHPCCRPEMYDFFYHNGRGHKNCLDNINACLNRSRAIIHPVNLFMHTRIDPDGSITVLPPLSKPGDKIVLQAEMNVRLGIAACSVAESSCNSGSCTPIKVIIDSVK